MAQARRSGRPAKKAEPTGIKAVDQALSLLDAITAVPGARSLMELSRATDMAPNLLHRYLVSLSRAGLVAQRPDGLYDLGGGAIRLGGHALWRMDERAALEPLLDEIVATLQENAFVYVWSGAGPVMVRTRSPSYSAIVLRSGTIAPMVGSASGPVFAAYLPRAQTEPIVRRDVRAAAMDEDAALHALYDIAVPRIRAEGLNTSETTLIPSFGACAAPVFDVEGRLFEVLGVSVRHANAVRPMAEVAAYTRDMAGRLSRSFGHIGRLPSGAPA